MVVAAISVVGAAGTVTASTRWPWTLLSSATGELPVPPGTFDQTALVTGDFDRDGIDEFMIGSRGGPNSLAWYRRSPSGGWTVQVVDASALPMGTGGIAHDVDGDGYVDLLMPGDHTSYAIWWWRNPGPAGWSAPWARTEVITTAVTNHHDMGAGDFDGDGRAEIAFWNQGPVGARIDDLFVAEVPADPTATPWPITRAYDATVASEGMDIADVDGDGRSDIVVSGGWLRFASGVWTFESIDAAYRFGRVRVGQLVPGGRPEVVLSSGDQPGDLAVYGWSGSAWDKATLLTAGVTGPWRHGHSLDIGDIDGDGHLDIFTAEMSLGAPTDARSIVFFGDGAGGWGIDPITDGVDNHESRLIDVDGDGDVDLVSKPFDNGSPGIRVYRNDRRPLPLDRWLRHEVGQRTARATFVSHGDLDGDGDPDLVTGAHWFENPGSLTTAWPNHDLAAPLTDVAAVADLDGDGDLDLFGTQGQGSFGEGFRFAWAQNNGSGTFTVRANLEAATRSFLQGVTVRPPTASRPAEIWLSWHDGDAGIHRFVVPADPVGTTWPLQLVSAVSQGEQIALVDIDRDGDEDLLEGHLWLRSDAAGNWSRVDLHQPTLCCLAGSTAAAVKVPDRVVAADVNRDGRLDAVVSHEADVANSVAWYEQPVDPTALWAEHVITSGGTLPILSLDVDDVDDDGDLDVVAAQHDVANADNGLGWVFENVDRAGGQWSSHVVSRDEESHDGMQLADLDGDGDLDVYTIGWNHSRVVVHENRSEQAASGGGWWQALHRQRVEIEVPPSPDATGPRTVAVGLDFSALMTAVGRQGQFDPGSLRVVEVDAGGAQVATGLAVSFTAAADFQAWLFAAGRVRIVVPGSVDATRYLQIYFESVDAGIPPGGSTIPTGTDFGATALRTTTRAGRVEVATAWDGSARPAGTGAFVELGGSLTMEAENFHVAARGTSVQFWDRSTATAGYSGSAAMVPGPDSGANLVTAGFAASAPSLRYRARFTAVGAYRVWLRARSPDANGNVVHVGLDGVPGDQSDRINRPVATTFGWTRSTLDGVSAVVFVPTPGVHTVDVWMGRDGFVLDKIHLTRGTVTPTGTGPAESPRDGTSANVPPTARMTVTTSATPRVVSFSGSGSTDPEGTIPVYEWDFGDGQSGSGVAAVHTYATNGSYLVALTVTDAGGSRHTALRTVTVTSTPPPPPPSSVSLSVADVSVREGRSGTTTSVTVRVSFSQAAPTAGSFTYRTVAGTATSGIDFVARSTTTRTFSAGTTAVSLTVTVRGDATREPNETFQVVIGSVSGATIAKGAGVVTIVNDD